MGCNHASRGNVLDEKENVRLLKESAIGINKSNKDIVKNGYKL